MRTLSFSLALLALAACTDAPADPRSDSSGTTLGIPEGASALGIAATPAGEVVAWVEGGTLRIQPAGASGGVVVADSVSSHGQAGPRIVALEDGALIVAFVTERTVEGRRFPASELWLARSDDGGETWSAPQQPYPDEGIATGHTFHSLAAGPDGTVAVAWLDGTARDRFRQSEAALAGRHGASPEASGVPVRLVHNGENHAEKTDEPGTQLKAAVSTDGGRTFGLPAIIADGTCQCCRTALHVDAEGTVYAVWRHIYPGSERDMALSRSTDGGATFSEPVRVHTDGWKLDGCPHAGPAITTDARGDVHVAWPTGADGRIGLWRAVSEDGGATFSEPSALLNGAVGQVRAATVGGEAVFAFEDGFKGEISVWRIGQTDTLRVEGDGADLASSGSTWHLVWTDNATSRSTSGS
ncbi:MAG: sialidase family protein [Bacteroidota bacterium]